MVKNLQYLRAFASINVVYLHILSSSHSYGMSTKIFTLIGNWGGNGVDIFFVISGFVMIHTQINKPKNIYEFYLSRLNRIIPIYWFITIFVVLIYFILPNETFRSLSFDFNKFFLSLLFCSQLIIKELPIVNLGWTLEWEMLFYLIFGLALYLKDIIKIIYFIFFIMIIIFLFSQNLLIFEFFLGMTIGYIFNKVDLKKNIGFKIFIVGIILLLLSINSNLEDMSDFFILGIKFDRFFIWGVPAALIVLGAAYSKQVNFSFLNYLGNASYSIYLVQFLTIPFCYKLFNNFDTKLNNDILTILCLLLSILFGCFFYSYVEKNLKLTKKVN
jgi:exopolysaccharide production protein ExoZ